MCYESVTAAILRTIDFAVDQPQLGRCESEIFRRESAMEADLSYSFEGLATEVDEVGGSTGTTGSAGRVLCLGVFVFFGAAARFVAVSAVFTKVVSFSNSCLSVLVLLRDVLATFRACL